MVYDPFTGGSPGVGSKRSGRARISKRSGSGPTPVKNSGRGAFTPAQKPAVRYPLVGRAPVARSSNNAIARRQQSGGGGGGPAPGGGPAVQSAPSPAPIAAKAPGPPTLDQFLRGDTTFMGQEAGLKKAGANFNTQAANAAQQYGEQYNLNNTNLATAGQEARTGLTDDFASRGMLNSGVYGKAYADQETEYKGRQAALDQARTQFLTDQTAGRTNFTEEQNLSTQKARQDAINRRAAQYNL